MTPIGIGKSLVFGKEAYTLTHDRRFWGFAGASNIGEAATFISEKCGVKALRYLDDDPKAVEAFKALKSEFDALAG